MIKSEVPRMRIGQGIDVHAFVEGGKLMLGGVAIPHPRGLAGHSDADALLHALCDALLGAVSMGDIGEHFPPSDERYKGYDSAKFVTHVWNIIHHKGWKLVNADLTVLCEEPKISPYRAAIRSRIAGLLGVEAERVSLKGGTTEKLGFLGRGDGLLASAVVLLAAD